MSDKNTNVPPVGQTFVAGEFKDGSLVITRFLVVTKNCTSRGWCLGDDQVEVCFGYYGTPRYFYQSQWGDDKFVDVSRVRHFPYAPLEKLKKTEPLVQEEVDDMIIAYTEKHGIY